eukprot:Hpha_TRINITY_DN10305_c0_g1::TRINITY_DN10305_c0_g1_i2::g.116075::m.116075
MGLKEERVHSRGGILRLWVALGLAASVRGDCADGGGAYNWCFDQGKGTWADWGGVSCQTEVPGRYGAKGQLWIKTDALYTNQEKSRGVVEHLPDNAHDMASVWLNSDRTDWTAGIGWGIGLIKRGSHQGGRGHGT